MSIFRRDPDSSEEASRSPVVRRMETGPPKATHIAPGCRIVGEIGGPASLRVDGEFEGKIHIDGTVVVGESGRIHGEVEARRVEVSGRVEGNVRGAERVEITASGALQGNISAPRVAIAEGAFFKGRVEMRGDLAPARSKLPRGRRDPVDHEEGTSGPSSLRPAASKGDEA